jgi:hypothetical protein
VLIAHDALFGPQAKGSAYVASIDASGTVATLASSGIGDGTGLNLMLGTGPTPWVKGAEMTWRYNKWRKLTSGMTSYSWTPNVQQVTKGQNYVYVHNVHEDIGWPDLDLPGGGTGRSMILYTIGTGFASAGLEGSGLAGNGTIRNSHNTLVKVTTLGTSVLYSTGGPGDLTTDLEFNDSVLAGPSGAGNMFDSDVGHGIWTPPFEVRRNVLFGGGCPAAVSVSFFQSAFPDNAGVLDETRVGFADYANGDYRLTDIFATGLVTLTATPIVFKESFARSFTSSNQLGPDLPWNATQFGSSGIFTNGSSECDSFLSNQIGLARCEATLPSADMYAQIKAKVFTSPGFQTQRLGPAVRYAAGTTDTCYYAAWLHDGTNITCQIVKRVAGSDTVLSSVADAGATSGDVLRLEASGAGPVSLTAKRNGVTIATASDSTSPITGNVRAGFTLNRGAPSPPSSSRGSEFEFGELVASNTSNTVVLEGGGSWPSNVVVGQPIKIAGQSDFRRIVSVSGDTLVLDSNYPHAAGSGLSFAVTFKGTATDGTDPGANIDWVDAWTGGVDTAVDPTEGGGGGGGGGTGTGGTARPAATHRPAITHRPAVTRRPVLI